MLRTASNISDKHPAYTMDVLGAIQERAGRGPGSPGLARESALGLDYRFPFLEETDFIGSYNRLAGVLRRLGLAAEADEAQLVEGAAIESGLGGLDAPPAAGPVDPFETTPMP